MVSWKCAQCGQVIEAYSITVTDALSSPMTMSGRASGFISSAAGIVSARAWLTKGGSEETPSTAVASAKVAVLWQNSRRVIRN